MENRDYISKKLVSIVNRINKIASCLPDNLCEYIEEVKLSIINLLISLKCENMITDNEGYTFLDKVSLYTELNLISKDLGICILLTSNNISLEDASFKIDLIMRLMAEYDSVFRWCYNNSIKKMVRTI